MRGEKTGHIIGRLKCLNLHARKRRGRLGFNNLDGNIALDLRRCSWLRIGGAMALRGEVVRQYPTRLLSVGAFSLIRILSLTPSGLTSGALAGDFSCRARTLRIR